MVRLARELTEAAVPAETSRLTPLPPALAQVRLQAHFATNSYEKLGGVQRYFAEGIREEYASGALDAKVEGALQEMRELSICGLNA